jgi:competence protein ComEC
MLSRYAIPIWKSAPMIRILLPFVMGIRMGWQLSFQIASMLYCFMLLCGLLFCTNFLPLSFQFIWNPLRGLLINGLLFLLGGLACWQKDIRHHSGWYGHFYHSNDYVIIRLLEPLVEKPKSYKAIVMVEGLVRKDTVIHCEGPLIVYLAKDSQATQLQYGQRLILNASLKMIQNSGNPGAFDYKQYAAFQQLFHQAFVQSNHWEKLPASNANPFQQFIYAANASLLNQLQRYIGQQKTYWELLKPC